MHVLAVTGRRFGVTSDTHDNKTDWAAVLASLKAAWGMVDGVLHCGDISSAEALGSLVDIAPVYATRSTSDPPECLPTLVDGARVLDVEGVRVGLTFALAETSKSAAGVSRVFGGPVSACVYGGTHEASIARIDEILFVNPGSPSLARSRTAALLMVEDGRARAEILPMP